MDDRNFTLKAATTWINVIETPNNIRDDDIYPRLKSWLDNLKGHQVLEIGSGQGACSAQVDPKKHLYTGIEPSEFLLARARDLYPDKNFLAGNAYNLGLPDTHFDGVFSVAVWHLLEDLKAAAKELARVLKPGASFFIVTANPDGLENWKALYQNYKILGKRLQGDIDDVLYLHSKEEILESLQHENLHSLACETFRRKNGVDTFILIKGANN